MIADLVQKEIDGIFPENNSFIEQTGQKVQTK